MDFRKGNMWDVLDQSQLFLITTNSYVRRDGNLVMGRGIALEAAKKYPHIPKKAGEWILHNNLHEKFYGLLPDLFDNNIGLFQVKLHYFAAADLNVINNSCKMLSYWVNEKQLTNINMNYPGIGAGKLSKASVRKVLDEHLCDLPITIWEY